MDLANAPDLSHRKLAAGTAPDQRGDMRLIAIDEAQTSEFQAAWQDLANAACEPNPYLEPWFVLPSLEAFANRDGRRARIAIAAFYVGDTLAGLLPITRSSAYYGYRVPHFVSWTHDNSFCGSPLVLPAFQKHFWRALFAQLERTLGTALFLHLSRLPVDGPLFHALEAVIGEQDRASAIVATASRAALASDLSPAQYLEASLSAKKRKELRRQHKRLSEEGTLTFERNCGADGLDQWIETFLTLEAAGWKGEGGTALANAADTRTFFAETLRGAAREGRLERLSLRLDDRAIALLANFISPPGAYSFKTTFDEGLARYSPGMLLQLENLDLLARDDIAWADSCAVEGHPMIERLWRERRTLCAINIALGGRLRRTVFSGLMAYETRNRSAK